MNRTPRIGLQSRVRVTAFLATVALAGVGCGAVERETALGNAGVESLSSAERLKAHVSFLAGDALRGRNAGHPGEAEAGRYVARAFAEVGLQEVEGAPGHIQPFEFSPRLPLQPFETRTSFNVVAAIPGSDPSLAREVVVVGAHYDGQGSEGEADAGRHDHPEAGDDTIWNSANDNASSVAALLEVARRLAESPPRRTLVLAAFGAEEHGLVGSYAFLEKLPALRERTVAMLNLEMLGADAGESLATVGHGTSAAWPTAIQEAERATDATLLQILPQPTADTDHFPFFLAGIPAMTLGRPSGERIHTALDELETVALPDLLTRTELLKALIQALANLPTIDPNPESWTTPTLPATFVPATPAEAQARNAPAAYKVAARLAETKIAAHLNPGDLIVQIQGQPITPQTSGDALNELHAEVALDGGCLEVVVATAEGRREVCL